MLEGVDEMKATLHRYLRAQRDAVRWKVAGLAERDLRMPMTPTGTNLLGLVKHLTMLEAGYFGESLARPHPEPLPLEDDGTPNADMHATADESADGILALYDRAIAHADANIEALQIDAPAHVPWWDPGETTLGRLMVHMTAETARHAGHIDILRERIDGTVGLRDGVSNLPEEDAAWWADYVERLRAIAEASPATRP